MISRALFASSLLLAAHGCGRDVTEAPLTEESVSAYLAKADGDQRQRILSKLGDDGSEAPAAVPERSDLIGRGGKPLTLVGKTVDVGDPAPDFVLKGKGLVDVSLSELAGKIIVLSVVPSIDTRVCETQTHKMSELEPSLPEGTVLLTVSRDLPFAQTRFVEEAQTKSTLVSDYRGGTFGRDWGLEVKETGLLARSVWVIDASGTVTYRELVADQSTEPDYDKLAAAVKTAASH